jgi:thiol-disulfide isomerase/thioredoxin
LDGKVVLVDFWTYTCINWLRTLGHIRAWAERYADHGLVVVGVHTPEFPFERDVDNVRKAVKEMAVDYRSRSTATTQSGKHSLTDFGRPSTSPMQKGESGTTNSARADTQSAKWSSSGC